MVTVVLGNTLSFTQDVTAKQFAESEKAIVSVLGDLSRIALFSSELDDLQQYLDRVAVDPRVQTIYVGDSQKTVVVSTDFSLVGKPVPALSNSEQSFWRTAELGSYGSIAVEFSNQGLQQATEQAARRGIALALSGMGTIALAGVFFGYLLTRRLTVLTDVTRKFAEGNLDVRANLKGSDEVASVGMTFDAMAFKITQDIRELEKRQTELQAARDELEHRVEERTAELNKANKKLQELSEIDTLTRLPNRRRFDDAIVEALAEAEYHREPVTLAVLDIDHFKKLNDELGHFEGDVCLQKVASAIKSCASRPKDMVARYGGEEFVMILPSTNGAQAVRVLEKVRKEVEKLSAPDRKISISIGYCTVENGNISVEQFFRQADDALYKAKEGGRNRVERY